MYLTGFADEAADSIEGQVRATQALGWRHLEARNVAGRPFHDLPEAEFDALCATLAEAGVSVNCYGSPIANWGQLITAPFEETCDLIARSLPRLARLGTKLVRIMSYGILPDRPATEQLEEERCRRLREIVARFQDAGLLAVHENCMNYGGMGWPFTLRLLENVPGLKLVYDTGNPVGSRDYAVEDPDARQDPWDFYQHVRDHIAYVHIKDGRFRAWNPDSIFSDMDYTWPGEGDGEVKRVVQDLLAHGYDGGFSMEPHMTLVFHDGDAPTQAEARHRNYLEYGQRFQRLLEELGYGDRLAAGA